MSALCFLALAAEAQDSISFGTAQIAGTIDHDAVREASGIARSNKSADRFWLINDGGSSPSLHAIDSAGTHRASYRLRGARNIDWEDLAAFSHDGRDWLIVADIGDNAGRRRHVTLYFVEEPAPGSETTVRVDRALRIRYPDGPRDAESIAIDAAQQQILILSKRTVPAEIYGVALFPHVSDEPILAEKLAILDSIPQPSTAELDNAALHFWYWQPTAMDISADNTLAVVLSYDAAFVYARMADEPWIAALKKDPIRLEMSGILLAESVAFSLDSRSVFVTVEGRMPPLIRFDQQ